jgi:hypothetical protein
VPNRRSTDRVLSLRVLVDEDIIEFDAHSMPNASVIGRPERTPSLGYTKDCKRFTDFGASARHADGQPDGGDVLELQVRVNAAQDGMSKAETLRQVGQQLKEEATQALKSAAHSGEQPPQWIQAFMSPTGWEHYHQLRNGAGRAITGLSPHIGGVAGFSSPKNDTPVSQTHTGQESHPRRDSVQAVPIETNRTHDTPEAIAAEHMSMQELEMIRDYGRVYEWPALVLDGEEIIPAGRADWLDFVWLSHKQEQQRRVYDVIRGQSQL